MELLKTSWQVMWPLLSAVSGQTCDSLPLRRPVRRAVIGSCSAPITILLFVCVRLAALSYNDGCTESDLKCLRDSLSNHCQDDPPQYTLIMIRGPYTRFTAFTFTPTYMQQTRSCPRLPCVHRDHRGMKRDNQLQCLFFSHHDCVNMSVYLN